jgi:Zn-dependent alcohol dehydrogenase
LPRKLWRPPQFLSQARIRSPLNDPLTDFIVDLADFRLKKAKEMGADYVMKIRKDMQDKDVIAKIKETLGEDPNVTIDCTGAEQCIRIALQVLFEIPLPF